MFVYSQKIQRFMQEIKSLAKKVITQEIGLKMHGERFYDREGRGSYPLKVVIYNHKRELGYFDPEFYELGFKECLMYTSREKLLNIIRHELAHYMVFIEGRGFYSPRFSSPDFSAPHGPLFREFCRGRGWGEEVYRATTQLESEASDLFEEESAILRKVQKLMALAASSNKHEAEQAMIKSQQLLLKHQIDSRYLEGEEEKMVLKRILKQKRECGKMQAIARILETFFVSVVYSRSEEYTYLEILGSEVNVQIADYIASILQRDLEPLWEEAQRSFGLKGLVAKNSFFRGLAKGYCDKIEFLKREYTQETTTALKVIETELDKAREMVYSRLTSKTSRRGHCEGAAAAGESRGRALTLNTALNKSPQNSLFLLG